MTIAGQFLFLGTGGSMGVPVVGCKCPVCLSDSPCNQRLRTSALLSIQDKKILIDCGPDFRSQALRHHIDKLDALVLTHSHHDHIAGIDELRVYQMHHKKRIPCLLSKETETDLRMRFHYIFDEASPGLAARMVLHRLEEDRGSVLFEGIPIRYVSYEQAKTRVNGFRFGNLAYISDIQHYPETIFEDLKGVEVLILSALRFDPSPAHLSVDEAISFSRRCGAQHTWITHIAHELDHESTNNYLPGNIRMSYDGLVLPFSIQVGEI